MNQRIYWILDTGAVGVGHSCFAVWNHWIKQNIWVLHWECVTGTKRITAWWKYVVSNGVSALWMCFEELTFYFRLLFIWSRFDLLFSLAILTRLHPLNCAFIPGRLVERRTPCKISHAAQWTLRRTRSRTWSILVAPHSTSDFYQLLTMAYDRRRSNSRMALLANDYFYQDCLSDCYSWMWAGCCRCSWMWSMIN